MDRTGYTGQHRLGQHSVGGTCVPDSIEWGVSIPPKSAPGGRILEAQCRAGRQNVRAENVKQVRAWPFETYWGGVGLLKATRVGWRL